VPVIKATPAAERGPGDLPGRTRRMQPRQDLALGLRRARRSHCPHRNTRRCHFRRAQA
jgi:hypothetical protein